VCNAQVGGALRFEKGIIALENLENKPSIAEFLEGEESLDAPDLFVSRGLRRIAHRYNFS